MGYMHTYIQIYRLINRQLLGQASRLTDILDQRIPDEYSPYRFPSQPAVQERLTKQIAEAVVEAVQPAGVAVVVEGT